MMKWYLILIALLSVVALEVRADKQQEAFCRTATGSTDSVVVAFCEGASK